MKRFKSLLILPVILLSLTAPAKAASRDFVNVKTGEVIAASDWRSDSTKFNDLISKLSDDSTSGDYAIQFGGKYYKYSGLLNALVNKGTKTNAEAFADALKDTSLIVTVDVSSDFDVISID